MLYPAARVLLHADREDVVVEIAALLDDQAQNQTRSYAALLRGEIAVRDGRVADGFDLFRVGLELHDSWFGRYLLGVTYEEAGRHAEALAELETCLNRRGETSDVLFASSPTVRYFPPVYYWLGRAQHGIGITGAARGSYTEFLALREGADPIDPLAEDAGTRLGTLGESP